MGKKSAALAIYNFHNLVTNKLSQQLRIKVDENYLVWNDWCRKWDDALIIPTAKIATTDNADELVNGNLYFTCLIISYLSMNRKD
jgi:hypothetical protein